jgi:hypothetical protein
MPPGVKMRERSTEMATTTTYRCRAFSLLQKPNKLVVRPFQDKFNKSELVVVKSRSPKAALKKVIDQVTRHSDTGAVIWEIVDHANPAMNKYKHFVVLACRDRLTLKISGYYMLAIVSGRGI